jgi:hypothetical protein
MGRKNQNNWKVKVRKSKIKFSRIKNKIKKVMKATFNKSQKLQLKKVERKMKSIRR